MIGVRDAFATEVHGYEAFFVLGFACMRGIAFVLRASERSLWFVSVPL